MIRLGLKNTVTRVENKESRLWKDMTGMEKKEI